MQFGETPDPVELAAVLAPELAALTPVADAVELPRVVLAPDDDEPLALEAMDEVDELDELHASSEAVSSRHVCRTRGVIASR